MNRHLMSSSRRSRSSILPSYSRWHPIDRRRFKLQVRLRGRKGPACEVPCSGLEEAIRFSQREFPAFADRNPWIGLDSLQQKIWILLDPETESTQ